MDEKTCHRVTRMTSNGLPSERQPGISLFIAQSNFISKFKVEKTYSHSIFATLMLEGPLGTDFSSVERIPLYKILSA